MIFFNSVSKNRTIEQMKCIFIGTNNMHSVNCAHLNRAQDEFKALNGPGYVSWEFHILEIERKKPRLNESHFSRMDNAKNATYWVLSGLRSRIAIWTKMNTKMLSFVQQVKLLRGKRDCKAEKRAREQESRRENGWKSKRMEFQPSENVNHCLNNNLNM